MLLVILAVIAAAGIFITAIGKYKQNKAIARAVRETKGIKDPWSRGIKQINLIGNAGENLMTFGIAIVFVSVVISCIFVFTFRANDLASGGSFAKKQQEYNLLIYKTHHEPYINESGEYTEELLNEIQQWNEEVAENQEMNGNIWVGVFVSDYWDNLQTIPLER